MLDRQRLADKLDDAYRQMLVTMKNDPMPSARLTRAATAIRDVIAELRGDCHHAFVDPDEVSKFMRLAGEARN